MNILVFGAGTVGCYVGAHLVLSGHHVTLVTRPDSAKHINEHGLAVTESRTYAKKAANRHLWVRPQAVATLKEALDSRPPNWYGLIILSMKSYDIAAAMNDLLALYPSPPTLMTLQNGIGIEARVHQALSDRSGTGIVLAGTLTTPVRRDSLGGIVVEKEGRGLAIAPTKPGQTIATYESVFKGTAIPTISCKSAYSMKWSKMLLNTMANATSAILNQHPEDIYRDDRLFNLEVAMLLETLAVMQHMNIKAIDLPGVPTRWLIRAVEHMPARALKAMLSRLIRNGRGNKMPSFHLDLAAGKKNNEVLYHNGAVARLGWQYKIPTPVNTTLTEIMLKIAHGREPWDQYQNNPERLLAEVQKRQAR